MNGHNLKYSLSAERTKRNESVSGIGVNSGET